MSSRRLGSVMLRIGGLLAVGVLLYVFARRIDWSVLWRELHHAELWPLLVATLLYFAALLGKAIVWRILLAPRNVVAIARLYRYTIAAFAGSALAPGRAGEVLRVLALKQRDGVAVADATGVAVAEKLLHAVTLLALTAPVPLLLPNLPAWVDDSLLVCTGATTGVLVAAYFAVGRVEARETHSWFARFLVGMQAVRNPKRLLATLGVLVVVWFLDVLAILVVLEAIDVETSVAGALFILFAINLSIVLPATPANVGTFQLGALVATELLGIPGEPALAFALLYHAVQIVPLLLVGFALEFRLVIPAGPRGKLAA